MESYGIYSYDIFMLIDQRFQNLRISNASVDILRWSEKTDAYFGTIFLVVARRANDSKMSRSQERMNLVVQFRGSGYDRWGRSNGFHGIMQREINKRKRRWNEELLRENLSFLKYPRKTNIEHSIGSEHLSLHCVRLPRSPKIMSGIIIIALSDVCIERNRAKRSLFAYGGGSPEFIVQTYQDWGPY